MLNEYHNKVLGYRQCLPVFGAVLELLLLLLLLLLPRRVVAVAVAEVVVVVVAVLGSLMSFDRSLVAVPLAAQLTAKGQRRPVDVHPHQVPQQVALLGEGGEAPVTVEGPGSGGGGPQVLLLLLLLLLLEVPLVVVEDLPADRARKHQNGGVRGEHVRAQAAALGERRRAHPAVERRPTVASIGQRRSLIGHIIIVGDRGRWMLRSFDSSSSSSSSS